jgi:hypothetical protein
MKNFKAIFKIHRKKIWNNKQNKRDKRQKGKTAKEDI